MSSIDPSVIAELPLFREFSREQLADMLRNATSKRYPKNTNVFEQDGKAHSFFVLLHGRLRVVKLTPDGQQVVMRYINPGDLFGVAMAIGRDTYPATSTAVVDSIALAWPTAIWPDMIARYPGLGVSTMQTIGSRLQDTQTRVVEMSTEEVSRRVAHALLRLAKQSGREVEQGIEIDFPISRQDIAEMTGTTLHTVSRLLSSWEGEGLVEGGRQRIILKDQHRLLLLAEGSAE